METYDDTESSSVCSDICESDTTSSFQFSDDAVNDQKNQLVKRNKKEKSQKNRQMRFNPMSAVATFRKLDKTIANLPQSFGNISLQNSPQPVFGTQVIYNGPVTIQKFYGEKRTNGENNAKLNDQPNNAGRFEMSYCSSNGEPITHGYKLTSETDNKLITDGKAPFRLVPKWMWLAREPNFDVSPLTLPAKRVIIANTETQEHFILSECCNTVKLIQANNMDAFGWADIGVHFLVGGDGSIYQGRGWNILGAHTKGYNEDSICIAFIGTFNNRPPPDRQLNVAQQFLESGVNKKKLIPNYKLYGQCQLAAITSPGKMLFEKIKSWPNWTNEL